MHIKDSSFVKLFFLIFGIVYKETILYDKKSKTNKKVYDNLYYYTLILNASIKLHLNTSKHIISKLQWGVNKKLECTCTVM